MVWRDLYKLDGLSLLTTLFQSWCGEEWHQWGQQSNYRTQHFDHQHLRTSSFNHQDLRTANANHQGHVRTSGFQHQEQARTYQEQPRRNLGGKWREEGSRGGEPPRRELGGMDVMGSPDLPDISDLSEHSLDKVGGLDTTIIRVTFVIF